MQMQGQQLRGGASLNVACWVPCPSSPCPGPGGWYCQLVVPHREAVRTQGVRGMLTESSAAPVMELHSPHCFSSLWPGILPSQLQLSEGIGLFFSSLPAVSHLSALFSILCLIGRHYWDIVPSVTLIQPSFIHPACMFSILFGKPEGRDPWLKSFGNLQRVCAVQPSVPVY